MEKEDHWLNVLKKIPAGYRLAKNIVEWERKAKAWADEFAVKENLRLRLRQFIEILARQHRRPWSHTVLGLWDKCAEMLGIKRRRMADYYRFLQEAGLLVSIERGRSADHTPKSTGRSTGETSLYAFILLRGLPVVDENCTPVPEGEGEAPRTRAGQDFSTAEAASPPLSPRRAAARRRVAESLRRRRHELPGSRATSWPQTGWATRNLRRERETLLSLQVQNDSITCRDIGTAHVAAYCRPFFEAGWCPADIIHALDWTPNGQQYPHDTVTGIDNVGAWLRTRLSAWLRDDRTPMRSRTARADAEAAQRRAEAVAAASRKREVSGVAVRPVNFEQLRTAAHR